MLKIIGFGGPDGPGGLTAQLGFNLRETQSVASDVAQYGGSSPSGESSIGDRDTSSDEAGVHADIKCVLEKPATIDIGSLRAQATQLSLSCPVFSPLPAMASL